MREKVSLELKAEACRPSPQLKIAPKKRYHLHISYKSCTFEGTLILEATVKKCSL